MSYVAAITTPEEPEPVLPGSVEGAQQPSGGDLKAWRLKRVHTIKVFMGMPVLPIFYKPRRKTYIEVGGQYVDSLRYEANKQKTAFLKWLAEIHGQDLKDDLGFSDQDLAAMKMDGNSPSGYDVHHRMPLGGCCSPDMLCRANDFDNLVLIKTDREHAAIHEFVQPQLDNLHVGGIIYLPTPVGYWQKSLGREQLEVLGQDNWQVFCEYEIGRQSALGLAIDAGRKFIADKKSVPQEENERYFECSAKILFTARAKHTPKLPRVRDVVKADIPEYHQQRAQTIKRLATDYSSELTKAFSLTKDELDTMKSKGKLPKRLVLYPRLPIKYCGTEAQQAWATTPDNMLLTTKTVKRELDRQFRKQLRHLKLNQTATIIMPFFDKPWFANEACAPDLEMVPHQIHAIGDVYPPVVRDVDIAAKYEALYEKPVLPEEPAVPLGKKHQKSKKAKSKKQVQRADTFIYAPYLAFEVACLPTEKKVKKKPQTSAPVSLPADTLPPPVKSNTESSMQAQKNYTYQEEFVRWIAVQFEEQVRHDLHLNKHDVEMMKEKGALPKHLTVAHRVPLRACGDVRVFERYERFDNMMILPVELNNKFNKIVKNQVSGMHPGQQKIIDLPVIPGYWPRKMSVAVRDKVGPVLVQGFETIQREQETALFMVMRDAQGKLTYPHSAHSKKDTPPVPPSVVDFCPLPRPHL